MRGRPSSLDARFERGDQMPVLDVVAESVEFDFGRVEQCLGRAKQALRVVDDAELSSGAACGRHAGQTPSISSALTELAKSAVVLWSGSARRRDQERFRAGSRQRHRADETSRAAADDRDFGM